MNHSENINEIMPALIKARGQFKAAIKDASNPHFKSAYATLDSVVDAVNDALLNNEILLTQPTSVDDNGTTILHTRFLHTSGQWVGSTYPVYPVKRDPQGEGSALTYARRYALMSLAGIAPEDDDGNAATDSAQQAQRALEEAKKQLKPSIDAIKNGIASGDLSSASEAWAELTDDEKTSIWVAPTKGGPFTTKEREVMKSKEFREARMGASENE